MCYEVNWECVAGYIWVEKNGKDGRPLGSYVRSLIWGENGEETFY